MKKIFFIIYLLSLLEIAQAQSVKNNENRGSVGMGVGWKNKEAYANSVHFPALGVSIERSVFPLENVGILAVGARFGFHHGFHKGKFPLSGEEYKQSWTELYFVPQATVYFQELFYEYDFPENIDLYTGVGIGLHFLSHKVPDNFNIEKKSGFGLGYRLFIGGRYYFQKDMAFFTEFGYGGSYLNLGVTMQY